MADLHDDPMDIEIDVDHDVAELQAQAISAAQHVTVPAEQNTYSTAPITADDTDVPDAYKDDFDKDIPVSNKMHIRGLDELDAKSLEAYLEAHTATKQWKYVEWIDDSSANIIWDRSVPIAEVITTFTRDDTSANSPLTDLRPAKPHPDRTEADLFIRQALVGDRKIKGARDRSRFYLMHPEHDPENRRRDNDRRGRDRRSSPRRDKTMPSFSADMYDDDDDDNEDDKIAASLSIEERDRHRQTFQDMFDQRDRGGRLRSRSRSPNRDGDGRYGFPEDEDASARRTARHRSRSPLRSRRGGDNDSSNAGKELFPLDSTSARSSRKELFPNAIDKDVPSLQSRMGQDRSAAAAAAAVVSGVDTRKANASKELFPSTATDDEASRTGSSNAGAGSGGAGGFSIKGRGAAMDDFAIIGNASRTVGPRVKELFPDHVRSGGGGGSRNRTSNNAGKELFGTSSATTGSRRRRAEDLF